MSTITLFNMTNAKHIIHAVGPNFSVTPAAFKELVKLCAFSTKEMQEAQKVFDGMGM